MTLSREGALFPGDVFHGDTRRKQPLLYVSMMREFRTKAEFRDFHVTS
jgi:hypothetical protein